MYKILILFTFSIVLLTACKEQIIIDNALNESITIQIDEKNYSLESNTFQELEINRGKHKIISLTQKGDTLLDTTIDVKNEGILNAGNITYILWTDIYCEENDYDTFKTNLELKDTITFEGLDFIDIDFNFYNEAFIQKNWDIGLKNKMPESVELLNEEQYKIVSKIFRPIEIKKEFNYIGDIDFNDLSEEEINTILKNRNQE